MTAVYDATSGRVKIPEPTNGIKTATAYHVLAALTTYTNHTTKKAWPSVATLAKDTQLSERTVMRALQHLRDSGVVVVADDNRKTVTYKPGWRVSARKKQSKLLDIEPVPHVGRSLNVMLWNLWNHGVRKVSTLAKKLRVGVRVVQQWVKHVTSDANYVSEEAKRATSQTNKLPSSLRSSVFKKTSSKPSRRAARLERIKRALAPWDVFENAERYADSEKLTSAIERSAQKRKKLARRDRPQDEWSIHDVIDEFRDRYREKYPTHSPDELGNKRTLSIRLGVLRKQGVPISHMIRAIDDFYREKYDLIRRDYPAWKKWLWCVSNTRPKTEHEYLQQQAQQLDQDKPKVTYTPTDPYSDRLEWQRAEDELEAFESEVEEYGLEDAGILRWGKNWEKTYEYLRYDVERYRKYAEEVEAGGHSD